ncbi:forkhead box protein C1-like [Penaeus monodon]|uniref:forkhead box protein C1-like n=1 Tax=Penaeus monodon TaxID=6687 RepID=UPI0018A77E1D|nr:forkhead box protein C1-like [Penaeus monodon]
MSGTEVGGRGGGPAGSREVHKNGWLKRMPTQERRLSVMAPFGKPAKAEKLWVSFCVHDESEGWLEFYENRRSAFSHNPIHRTSLARCLHVSPSIRVHEDNEHVFAITLEGEVIKLGAQSREQMMEWIDSLRSRLRELGVLTPKDNLYSKEPEGLRSPLLRNPNSPLPPTPMFQFPPHALEFRDDVSSLHSMRLGLSPAPSMTLSTVSGMSGLSSMQSLNSVSSGSSDPNTSPSSVVTYVRHHHDPPLNRRSSFRASLPSSPTTPAGGSGSLTFLRSPPGPQAAPPREHVTVINVPSPTSSVFNFDSVGAALESSGAMANSQLYGAVYPTPDPSICDSTDTLDASEVSYSTISDPNAVQLRVGNSLGAGGSGGGGAGGGRPPLPPGQRCASGYGSAGMGAAAAAYGVGGGGMSASGGGMAASGGGGTVGASSVAGGSWSNVSSPESSYEPLFLASSAGLAPPPTPTAAPVPQAPQTGLLRRRSEHRRSGRREHGRRAASVGPSIAPKQQPQQQYQVGQDGRLMSLREQQVIRLQREIAHQAGVRLTLRKKDCMNSIAFVNVFNHVYVAGWKQREHPYLHNTFHIGDRLVSVCGVQVTSAQEAHNLIKNEPTMMVEFIIRRVPHGRVFALKRETEGQALGVIREGNTAEIREIVPGGLAAQHGVPPKSQTVDGTSFCSWVLTEINHRPLNLFFKHMEIADRLNAVGRDISILIQPMDLVKQLKKSLKALKGYKDYIVM